MAKLQLFFTYFGGKWRTARHYPAPAHEVVVEPFAGSAGYSLHHPERQVLLFDLDPVICGVWDYLIRASEAEVMALPAVVEDVRRLAVPQEARWLIGFWLNKGTTSPCNVPSAWMRGHAGDAGRRNTYWGEGVRRRIASHLRHIRHWKVENRSYEGVENREATWFVDPPYEVSGSRYRFHSLDYGGLAGWCRSRLGQVVVCEQEGAGWLPFSPFRVTKALEGKKGANRSREVVWIGGA